MKKHSLILLVLIGFSLQGKKPKVKPEKLIESIEVTGNNLKITVHKGFKERYLLDDFFITYDDDINLEAFDESIQILPFLMNVISIIWVSGEAYYVDTIDEDIYNSLTRVKKVLQRLYPGTKWEGTLIAKKCVKNEPLVPFKSTDTHVAQLFSAGLDSTCASLLIPHKQQLLVTAWGFFDLPLEDIDLWNKRKTQIETFAHHFGHETTYIYSNFTSFLNRRVLDRISPEVTSWRPNAVEGIGWAGLIAPILLSKGYKQLNLATSGSWSYPYPAAYNPYIDDNLHVGGANLHHTEFDMSRLEKVRYVANYYNEHPEINFHKINTCEKPRFDNCSLHCKKCIRTVMAFMAIGEKDLELFGYPVTPDEVLESIQEYLTHAKKCTSVYRFISKYRQLWHLNCAQDELYRRRSLGELIPSEFEWFMNTDLTSCITVDFPIIRHKSRWEHFDDLLPEGIERSTTPQLNLHPPVSTEE